MSTYPTDNRAAFIDWCQSHGSVFMDNAVDIGLTPQLAAAFSVMTGEAAEAVRLQNEAIQAARAATRTAQAKLRQLRIGAGNIVRTIRAFAENEKVPLIAYNLAQIHPPAAPSPAPPPDLPRRLSATLDATGGALTVRWKARNPSGTRGVTYLVRRRLPGESAFAFVGATGEKWFVDRALPAGMEEVEYTVQAVRGKRSGAVSAIFTVRIGSVRPTAPNATSVATAAGAETGGAARNVMVVSALPGAALRHGSRAHTMPGAALRHGTRALRDATRLGAGIRQAAHPTGAGTGAGHRQGHRRSRVQPFSTA